MTAHTCRENALSPVGIGARISRHPTPSRISGARMWPTARAVGSRQTESTLSHVVATEDLRSSRQVCRPSRGFSGESARLSPHGCRRGPHSCARRGGLRNPI